MGEWVDIWTKEGEPTGKSILKSDAHKLGYYHPTVHLWLYNDDQQVLLQRRVLEKNTFPGKWDVSVAGHISAGDTPEATAIREGKEELGVRITPEQLIFIGVMRSDIQHAEDLIDREFHHIYAMNCNLRIDQFILQKEEVMDVRWINLGMLQETLTTPNSIPGLVPFEPEYLKKVTSWIASRF